MTDLSMDVQPAPARLVYQWLLLCCFMIFAMAIIGAITRLTESGLSIVEWRPITGTIPPLTEQAWQVEFEKYRTSPEYIHKNASMSLNDFKYIFFWEWLHRLWGRLIGLVFALPLAFFALRGYIPRADLWRYGGLLVLGGLQGFVGWFMVQSGLIDRPSVSHYRLALHLSLALLIFALTLRLALRVRQGFALVDVLPAPFSLRLHGTVALVGVALTIIWGAFVAGLDAGLIYNEFPRMGAGFVPLEIWSLSPRWLNIFENHAAVQFTHRWLAVATFFIVLWFAVRCLMRDQKFTPALTLAGAIFVQLGLGIATLLTQVAIVPATLHQAGAILVLAALIITCARLKAAR